MSWCDERSKIDDKTFSLSTTENGLVASCQVTMNPCVGEGALECTWEHSIAQICCVSVECGPETSQ